MNAWRLEQATSDELLHVERVLPDYTWPQRIPIDELRRIIKRESDQALLMAREAMPAWRHEKEITAWPRPQENERKKIADDLALRPRSGHGSSLP